MGKISGGVLLPPPERVDGLYELPPAALCAARVSLIHWFLGSWNVPAESSDLCKLDFRKTH